MHEKKGGRDRANLGTEGKGTGGGRKGGGKGGREGWYGKRN